MENSKLQKPMPKYDSQYQNGISDPIWPATAPNGIDPLLYDEYKGRVSKQDCLNVVKAKCLAGDRKELQALLKGLSVFIRDTQEREPSLNHMRTLDKGAMPQSWRVTVTLGLGSSIFVSEEGYDRYDIRGFKPKYLKAMPKFPGDSINNTVEDQQSDLILIIASDHPYINVAVARYFTDMFNRNFALKNPDLGGEDIIKVVDVQSGFARPDKREFLRFDDGIDNLRASPIGDLERLVYVSKKDGEPDWCVNGSYMVYRKIKENLAHWEKFSQDKQEKMIGRHKDTGVPLSRQKTGDDNMTPVYPDPQDDRDGPLNCHIRKVQPRRPEKDLFEVDDLDRRFLRRPYPFYDGLGIGDNQSDAGLHFIAYMKSLQNQFEHVTNMWQLNPDFPTLGAGIDALYKEEIFSTLGGGYYFCPPAPKDKEDFFCSDWFKSER